jgi:hypothetical protein
MSKGKHRKPFNPVRDMGKILTELRRSHAAGYHGKHAKDRHNAEREAVEQEAEDDR